MKGIVQGCAYCECRCDLDKTLNSWLINHNLLPSADFCIFGQNFFLHVLLIIGREREIARKIEESYIVFVSGAELNQV